MTEYSNRNNNKQHPDINSQPRDPFTTSEFINVALLLLALIALFFWPALKKGSSLLPADLIFDLDPLWQSMAPENYNVPNNPLLSDQVYQFFPWQTYVRRALAQGHIPLWNPYTNTGQPFLGNAQSAVFDPFNLITLLFPIYVEPAIKAAARLFIAGFFTYCFARQINLTQAGAILAMVTFTFSGPMTNWIGYPLASVIAWMPALLFISERIIKQSTSPSILIIANGIIIGVQFLGGHPETSFLVLLGWGGYTLYRVITLYGWNIPQLAYRLLPFVSAGIIGLFIGAVQLLPFLEAAKDSSILASRKDSIDLSVTVLLRILFAEWQHWTTVVTLLLPNYFGTPLNNSYMLPYNNYIEQNLYAGVLPLALTLTLALQVLKNRTQSQNYMIKFFIVWSLVCIGIALRFPLINIVNYLPLFSISANGRLRLLYTLGIAILAGFGLDNLQFYGQKNKQITLYILLGLAAISLVIMSITYMGFVIFKDTIISFGRSFIDAQWGTPYFSKPIEEYYRFVEQRYALKLSLFHPNNITMYIPILVAVHYTLCYYGTTKSYLKQRIWNVVIILLSTADVFLVNMPFNPTMNSHDIYPVPQAIQFIQQDPTIYRVIGSDLILQPNSSIIFELCDVRGYEPMATSRYMNLLTQMPGSYRLHHHLLITNVDSHLLDLFNVKYVITNQALNGRWELVYKEDSDIKVYRNQHVMPRAFMVYQAKVADSSKESLQYIIDSKFDFRENVILEEFPDNWEAPATAPNSQSVSSTIISYNPEDIKIEVTTPTTGLLVLTDTYTPGWTATIDGEPQPIYIADHAFRAVVISRGNHKIHFIYNPLCFQIGASMSLSTLVLSLLLTILLLIKTNKR